MTRLITMKEAREIALQNLHDAEQRREQAALDEARGSGEADPLMSELQSLAATEYPLCPEARLLLEVAVEAQKGKLIDVTPERFEEALNGCKT